ncbi:hypothetical protein H3Z83_04360 [Tenacibaculum sp. S7007]|uniref:DUF4595 domain-containing protein n=1 Tax=Tenacibaculum pelagium TaxID=2759527 RepID=A0A839AMQ5_9FLAO|nr:hypothetical protein [Tenacibaculum pelagium]MBA6155756.1 hypothetical protein [Tenacibaculum pelagium]
MKKILLPLIFLTTLISSCSSNEGEIVKSKETLSNYKISFVSGDEFTHYFDGDKGIRTKNKDNFDITTFEYNNDKLNNHSTFRSNNSINESYTFVYDTDGNITSTKEIGVYSSLNQSDVYTREFTYNNNSIISKVPHELFTDKKYIIEIKLNDTGLIEEFSKKDSESNELSAQFNFSYDENENCTTVIKKVNFGGTIYESTVNNTYDNKINPLYKHYRSNYIPYLIIYGKSSLFGNDITSLVRTFGKNNITATNDVYFEYEYNNNDYPTSNSVKQKGTNTLSYTTEFNYN